MSRFQKATRKKLRLRTAIDGPAGSGKSFTALIFARALAGPKGRIAAIDTEHGSLSKYAGVVGGEFDVLELTSFSPTEYTLAIEEAGQSGYDVILIDSLSHAWEGKDGALELVDKSGEKSSYTAWKNVTPMHRRMVEAILASPAHVICTMRSRVEHVLERDEKTGKNVPRKVGMAPVQRQGMEYEFDLYGSMDQTHVLTISKSRCPAVDNAIVVNPSESFMVPVIRWLNTGESVESESMHRIMRIDAEGIASLINRATAAGITPSQLTDQLPGLARVTELSHLMADQIKTVEQWIDGEARRRERLNKKLPKTAEAKGDLRAAVKNDPVASTVDQMESVMGGKIESPSEPVKTGLALEDQVEAIRDLKERLDRVVGSSDWYGKVLAKRNVKSSRDLTIEQADEIIKNVRSKLLEVSSDEHWSGPVGTWPSVMRSLVLIYGEDAVTKVGTEELGYPPILAHQVGEANRVSARLREAYPDQEGGE